MTKFFAFLASSSEKRPWLVVICVALVTVFLVSGISMLQTEFSQEGMMPEKYESMKALETVKDEFGGLSYENILVVANDVTTYKVAGVLAGLSPKSLEEDGKIENGQVRKVETYLDGMQKMVGSPGHAHAFGFHTRSRGAAVPGDPVRAGTDSGQDRFEGQEGDSREAPVGLRPDPGGAGGAGQEARDLLH